LEIGWFYQLGAGTIAERKIAFPTEIGYFSTFRTAVIYGMVSIIDRGGGID